MVARAWSAVSLAAVLFSIAPLAIGEKCGVNQYVASGVCTKCPPNMVRNGGDNNATGNTFCDPSGVYLSLDSMLGGKVRCRSEVTTCFSAQPCVEQLLLSIRNTSFVFKRPVDPKIYGLIKCAATLALPPPPPPPSLPSGGENKGPVDVTVGGLFPLSGQGCEIGWHAQYGAMKAVQVLNCEAGANVALSAADGAKVGIEVKSSTCAHVLNVKSIYKDTKEEASQALFDTDQMLHAGVDAIVGPLESSNAKMVSLLAKFDQVPVISYGASMAKLANESQTGITNFMRTFPSDDIIIKGLVDLIQDRGWEGVTFISTGDEYGMDAAKMFDFHVQRMVHTRASAGKQTLRYAESVLMDPKSERDMEDKFKEIKASGWRIVILFVTEEEAAPILHQAAKQRMLRLGWVWLGAEWAGTGVFTHKINEEGRPDGLSTDGSAEYLKTEMNGLIALQVSDITSKTGKMLVDAFEIERDAFVNVTMCPSLAKTHNLGLHKAGAFAFDSVLVAAAGIKQMADMRQLDSNRKGHWWRAGGVSVDAGVEGRGQMWKKMQATQLKEVATGTVDIAVSGDPDMVNIQVINWADGYFNQVGHWVQDKKDFKKCLKSKDTCGVLTLDDDKITWMGGAKGGSPPDRQSSVNHVHAQYMTLVIIFLIFAIVGGNIIELVHFHYMPEAGFTIIVGFLCGLLIKFHGYVTKSYHMEELAAFDEKVFALVLLPIIIFDAGFGAKKARFFMNLGPILVTALAGTTISTFVVGAGIYASSGITEVDMGIAESLSWGAVISAVDPVATLAVFGALKVEPNLNYRVFGESIINDAVSIVYFRVFQKFIVYDLTAGSALAGVFDFVVIFFGSTAGGILIGLAASLTMKFAHIHDPLLASGTFITCSYIAYEATEAVHLSGIIASLFCGFTMKHYALNNIAEQYRTMVLDIVHMLACMADLMIFFSVGTNVVLMAPYDKKWFIVVSMLLCIVGRSCNIFPLCGLWNITASAEKRIPFKDQLVMVHSGLRGAIAFALALGFPTQNQKYVIDATTWVVLITVFCFGGTTVSLLKILNVEMGCEPDPSDMKYIDAKKIREEYYQDGWATEFNCKLKMVMLEYQLKRCVVTPPEDEMGVFSLTWEEMTEDQQTAARSLGYSDVGAIKWPNHPYNKWAIWDEYMNQEDKLAAQTLGLDSRSWPPPDFSSLLASDLKVKQHQSGHDDGYVEPVRQLNPVNDEDDTDE